MQYVTVHRSHLLLATAAILVVGALVAWRLPGQARASADTPSASDLNVRCAAAQQTLVRQTFDAGRVLVNIECVDGVPDVVTGGVDVLAPVQRPPVRAAYPAPVPAAYVPAPAYASPVAPPRTSRRSGAAATTERSWQKRAAVIGGSTGIGAGIGALIGGKKGALIGAAIGGGGGTLYEVSRKP